VRTLVLTANDLNTAEKQALFHLGNFLAKMTWIKLYSENKAFREGVRASGGQVSPVGNLSPGTFNAIILYRILPNLMATDKIPIANIKTIQHLRLFIDEAVKDLYRRGILL
jgi:hypothetical protein